MISYLNNYENLFDKLAYRYHLLDYLSLGLTANLRKNSITNAVIPGCNVVVDLMCGTGNNVINIRKKLNQGVKYIGFDISDNMLKIAERNYNDSKDVTLIKANILNTCFQHYNADLALCSFGLKCIKPTEYDKFAKGICTLIRNGGTLSFTEFQLPTSPFIRSIFMFYLKTFFCVGCLLCYGNTTPAKALIETLSHKIDIEELKEKFLENGIEIYVKLKWFNTILYIYGEKKVNSG